MTIQMTKYLERKFSEFYIYLYTIVRILNIGIVCYYVIRIYASGHGLFVFFLLSDTASVFLCHMSNDQTTLEYCLKYVNCYICYIFWKQLH